MCKKTTLSLSTDLVESQSAHSSSTNCLLFLNSRQFVEEPRLLLALHQVTRSSNHVPYDCAAWQRHSRIERGWKRITRMFERRYRRSCSNADRHSWIDQTRRKQRVYASKQNQYWEDKISSSRGNPLRLWTNLSAVLRHEKTTPVVAGLHVEGFVRASSAKLENVRSTMSAARHPSYTD